MLDILFAAALIAQPDVTPPPAPIGQRSGSAQSLLADVGLAPGDDDLAAAIAAADAYPLGSRENPVRVGGPEGEHAYLARLRCADGSNPRIGPRSAAGTGAFGSLVDGYLVTCAAAPAGDTTILMDMYHEEHRENRAPPGFTLSE